MTDDDVGTVRWFGASWNAPVCDRRAHIETPVDQPCGACGDPIRHGDQGVSVLTFSPLRTAPRSPYHLSCWFRVIGVPLEL
jgi:hypothetical protein